MKTLKRVSVTVVRSTADNKAIVKTLVNGIHVLTTETHTATFSNLRTKKAFKSTWHKKGLVELLGVEVESEIAWGFKSKAKKIFENVYPDLKSGYAGYAFNTREVREVVQSYLESKYNESLDNHRRNAGLTPDQISEFRAEAEIS